MKNTTVGLLFLMAFMLPACKKQLNALSTTLSVDGNVIVDRESAQKVLNGVYYRFVNAGVDDFTNLSTGWTNVCEQIPSRLSGLAIFYENSDSLNSFTFSPSYAFVDSIWQYSYSLVNAANGFIKNITSAPNISAATKQEMVAEAKFLRAFGNSELLLYYGQYNDPSSPYGIILRDSFVMAANVNLPRSGVAVAYTSILADLDDAIIGLPVLNSAIYYANAPDAKLLKARVLMNRGSAGDYAQVITLTNDIITNGPFELEDSLKAIFLTHGFNSREVMLGIQPYPNQVWKFENYLQDPNYIATYSLTRLLTDDARSQWVCSIVTSLYSGAVNGLTKYYSGDRTNIKETSLNEYCYAFRLSEAYLLEAEAITLSTGDLVGAKALLTTVMGHAGAGPKEMAAVANASTPAALQLEIVKENMRNFAYENGVDWFALRRLPFATIQLLNPNIKDPNKLIFPIPAAELTYNNVIQNPGY